MQALGHDEHPAAFWFNRTAVPEPHGLADRSGFARGDGLLPLSAWVALRSSIADSTSRRCSTGGPWPEDALDLVRGVDFAATDTSSSLRVAVRHAGWLSPVTTMSRHDGTDPCAILRARLEALLAASGSGDVDALDLVELREAADEVLALFARTRGPLADMWTYTAEIGSHVAAHELSLTGEDEDVSAMRP